MPASILAILLEILAVPASILAVPVSILAVLPDILAVLPGIMAVPASILAVLAGIYLQHLRLGAGAPTKMTFRWKTNTRRRMSLAQVDWAK